LVTEGRKVEEVSEEVPKDWQQVKGFVREGTREVQVEEVRVSNPI